MSDRPAYDVLGVSKDADTDTIKQAYRKKARKKHPDAGGAADEFRELNNAYAVLVNPERRKRYDETGEADTKDRAMDAATQELIGMVMDTIEAVDFEREDIFKIVRGRVEDVIKILNQSKLECEAKAKKFDRAAKRVIRKAEGTNLFAEALSNQATRFRENMAKVDEKIGVNRDMLTMLETYEWKVDERFQSEYSFFQKMNELQADRPSVRYPL